MQRDSFLAEYPAGREGQLNVLWEDGKMTDLVFDSRFMAKPAREVKAWGFERPLYPLKDYPKRLYTLSVSNDLKSPISDRMESGPVEIAALPKGTKVKITRSYTNNSIDWVCHQSEGTLVHPLTGKEVTFGYELGCRDTIGRAPWEDESVEEKRFVGFNGKSYRK